MTYRTYTYLAADWDNDRNIIDKLRSWNDSDYWGLSFKDAHDLMQSKDTSRNCSIKSSLCDRMDVSKTFVLVVGMKTKTLRAGSCYCCSNYRASTHSCENGWSTSNKSFIGYECDKAVRDRLKIVVLYNSARVAKHWCPEAVANIGIHIPAYHWDDNHLRWNYPEIKNAIMHFN